MAPYLHLSVGTYAALLIMTGWVPSFATGCPSQCACNAAAKSVVCSSAGYASLTMGLPPDTEHLAIRGSYSHSVAFHHLTKKDLQIFPNLKSLVISHTQLTTIDRDAFSSVQNLKNLDLSFNHISRLEPGVFQGLKSLRFLILTGNEGCTLQPGVFQGLSSLLELYLGSMKLGVISSTLFMGLDTLEALDLSDNELEKVPVDFIFPSVFQHLKLLDLSFNHLMEMSHTLEPLLQRVNKVKLGDNPWHCTCTLLWLKSYPQHIFNGHGTDAVTCHSPDQVKYQTLAHLANQSLVCVPPAISSCKSPDPLLEGDTLVIKCQIAGDPLPDVSWILPDGSKVQGDGDAGKGIAVNKTKDEVELTVRASIAWNGTLQIMLHNIEGMSHSQIPVIVWPITTTTTTTTTSTTTTTTTMTPSLTTASTTTAAPTTTTTSAPTSRSPTTTISHSTTSSQTGPVSTRHLGLESTTASSKKVDNNLQKTLIFGAAAIASVGLISAVVVGVILFKYMSASSKVKPMKDSNFQDYFSPKDSKTPSSSVAPSSTRSSRFIMTAWEP